MPSTQLFEFIRLHTLALTQNKLVLMTISSDNSFTIVITTFHFVNRSNAGLAKN